VRCDVAWDAGVPGRLGRRDRAPEMGETDSLVVRLGPRGGVRVLPERYFEVLVRVLNLPHRVLSVPELDRELQQRDSDLPRLHLGVH
jgi:hypothetical protein